MGITENSKQLFYRNKTITTNKEIIKPIVLIGLTSNDRYERKFAIKISRHFDYDKQILQELKKIDDNDKDKYNERKNGLAIYPLREEAGKLLMELGEKR